MLFGFESDTEPEPDNAEDDDGGDGGDGGDAMTDSYNDPMTVTNYPVACSADEMMPKTPTEVGYPSPPSPADSHATLFLPTREEALAARLALSQSQAASDGLTRTAFATLPPPPQDVLELSQSPNV